VALRQSRTMHSPSNLDAGEKNRGWVGWGVCVCVSGEGGGVERVRVCGHGDNHLDAGVRE